MEQCSTEGTRVVCLCFRTEEQARNLLTFAALFAQSPEISYELVHSPGRDGSPAGRLAPWLEGLRHDFEDAASAERVRLRDVSRNHREASFDIALGAPWLILVSTDDHDRSADRFARSLFLEPSATSLLVHGRVNAPPRRMLMPAEGLAEEDGFRDVVQLLRSATPDLGAVGITSVDHDQAPIDVIQSHLKSLASPDSYVSMVRRRSSEAALLAAAAKTPHDIVLSDALPGPIPGGISRRTIPARLLRRSQKPVVLVNRPAPPMAQRALALGTRLFKVLPTLTAPQRAQIYAELRRSARADTDFLFMIVASASLAALGLRLDSAVVIIGAMLVAPLMSPIVGAGLAVSQGDGKLLRLSVKSVARGIAMAVGAATILGLLLPPGAPTGEMLKRANPTLLDLAVAVASGLTGAYALSRKGVASSLPGVAIAVSLVPPLATTGIAMTMGEPRIAVGSFLLFSVNLAAVAASSGVMFLWMGFRPEAGHLGRRQLFNRGFAGLGTLLVAVSIPLALVAFSAGSPTGLDDRLESSVAAAVERELGGELTSIEAAREDEALLLEIEVQAPSAPGKDAVAKLQSIVEGAAGEPVELSIRVQLVIAATAGDQGAEAPGTAAVSAPGIGLLFPGSQAATRQGNR